MMGSPVSLRVAVFSILTLAPAAFAHDVHYTYPAAGYRFDAAIGGFASDKLLHLTHFLFKGHAVATSPDLEFRAERIQGVITNPPGAKKAILRHADTEGKAEVKRTVKSASGPDVATIDGSRFVFDGDAKVGRLAISGPVTITDTRSGHTNLRMLGAAGDAELDMSEQNAQSALRTADLAGSVVVDIQQVGKDAGSVHATGEHLRYDNTTTPATLVLTGNVTIHGENGNETGDASGIQKLKFVLDKQGQFTRVDAGMSQESMQLASYQIPSERQDSFSYASKDGSLVLSGFEGPYRFSYDAQSGDLSAAGAGRPAHIEFKPSGLSISAESLDVKAARSAGRQFYLVAAHTAGNSHTVLDSSMAQAFQASKGAALSKDEYKVQLTSERTEYAGSETEGTLMLPTPFDADGHVSGERTDTAKTKPGPVDFRQAFKLQGTSGVLDIDPQAGAGSQAVKSGTFAGPIGFSAERTETHLNDHSESTFSLTDGHCDRMKFQSGTADEALSFVGHVQFLVVDSQGRMPVRNGDLFTFHFDSTLAPVSVDGRGAPLEIAVPLKTKQR